MGKVAIYARVSTVDKQDYQRQISDCKTAINGKYSDDNIEIFGERISGYKKNEERPALTTMLDIIENDPSYFDVIYITEISRLGREPRSTRNLLDHLTDLKVPIHITSINKRTLDENGERDSTMNIIIQVLLEFSDSESKTLKKRSKSGMLQSVVNGKAGGSKNMPYGYKKDENKMLVIDDIERLVIEEIFNLYSKGNGVQRIATILNERKVPTKAKIIHGDKILKFKTETNALDITWREKTVLTMLKNPIFKGDRLYLGNIYPAPAIVSTELWDFCNALLLSKTNRNYNTTYDYLLRGHLKCAKCGRNYFALYKPNIAGGKLYICSSRNRTGGNCGNLGVNITYLDSSVYDMLITSKILLKYLDKTDELTEIINAELNKLNTDLLLFTAEKNKFDSRAINILELFEDGYIKMNVYKGRMDKHRQDEIVIDVKIENVTRRIVEQKEMLFKISNNNGSLDILKDLTTNRAEIINIFNQFIESIYISKIGKNKELLVDIRLIMGNKKSESSLKLLLDLNQLKYKKPKFSYNLPKPGAFATIYNNGVLATSEEEILSWYDEKRMIKYDIPEENVINIINQIERKTIIN